MPVGPVGGPAPIPRPPELGATEQPAQAGFGDALARGLEQVSSLENHADALISDVAAGGPTQVHEMMIATTEAALAADLLVQVRDRALEAYHEVMRLQL